VAIPVSLAEGQASEKTRSLIVRGILIFGIIVNLGSVILYNARVGLIDALQQGVATQEQAEGSDVVVALIALIQLAVYVTTVVSWLSCLYQSKGCWEWRNGLYPGLVGGILVHSFS